MSTVSRRHPGRRRLPISTCTFPGIGARVLDDDGRLRRFVNVYVNDDDVRFLEDLQTPTPDGASISIIPAVAGG